MARVQQNETKRARKKKQRGGGSLRGETRGWWGRGALRRLARLGALPDARRAPHGGDGVTARWGWRERREPREGSPAPASLVASAIVPGAAQVGGAELARHPRIPDLEDVQGACMGLVEAGGGGGARDSAVRVGTRSCEQQPTRRQDDVQQSAHPLRGVPLRNRYTRPSKGGGLGAQPSLPVATYRSRPCSSSQSTMGWGILPDNFESGHP